MFKVGDYVVYRREVCKLMGIEKNNLSHISYYILIPEFNKSLTIKVPIDNSSYIKSLLSKKEIEALIMQIPNIQVIESNNRLVENEYKLFIHSGKYEDLIKIIKTAYFKDKARADNKKKIGERGGTFFNQAEKFLYEELSVALGIDYDDAKNYIISEIAKGN